MDSFGFQRKLQVFAKNLEDSLAGGLAAIWNWHVTKVLDHIATCALIWGADSTHKYS